MRHTKTWAAGLLFAAGVLFAAGAVFAAEAAADSPGSAEPRAEAGEIAAVTVYRGQAMVTRMTPAGDETGLRQIVVGPLPEAIVGGSVYADSAPGVLIQSVRYRTRPVMEDVREQVRELENQIQTVERDVEKVDRHLRALSEQMEVLRRLENFQAPAAEWELSRGVLDASVLEQLTGYLFEERDRIHVTSLERGFEKADLEAELDHLRRERSELAGASSRTAREAVVFAEVTEPGSVFPLRYLVNNAGWEPSYNMRAGDSRDEMVLEYLASVRQTTGEDWPDVRMTLSTATPSLVAQAPELSGVEVALMDSAPPPPPPPAAAPGMVMEPQMDMVEEDLDGQLRALEERRRVSGVQEGAAFFGAGLGGGVVAPDAYGVDLAGLDLQLNTLNVQRQGLEFRYGRRAGEAAPEDLRRRTDRDEVLTVTYELEGRASLPSRADRQLVRISEDPLEAEFSRVAIPALTSHVYEEADVSNGLGRLLLAGPANSYLNGEFVGRSDLPTVTTGERFKAGFGIDAALRASRTLMDRSESVQGGNRVVEMRYQLTLSNFGGEAKTVRLMDSLPMPKRGDDIRVSLLETSHALVSEPDELRGDGPADQDARLRWDVDVPAGAHGEDAVKVEFRYTMAYDRQKEIATSAAGR